MTPNHAGKIKASISVFSFDNSIVVKIQYLMSRLDDDYKPLHAISTKSLLPSTADDNEDLGVDIGTATMFIDDLKQVVEIKTNTYTPYEPVEAEKSNSAKKAHLDYHSLLTST